MQCQAVVTVSNRGGIHGRPIMMLLDAVAPFSCEVRYEKIGDAGTGANGRSFVDLLCLAAAHGTQLNLTCEGEDADKAMNAILELFEQRFDEER